MAYTILEHPADIGVEAKGKTLTEAFEEAAVGLSSIIVELPTVKPQQKLQVELTSYDRESLLVKWLSEVLFLYDARGFLTRSAHITSMTPTSLKAVISGERLDQHRHALKMDVKAATYHQLKIKEQTQGSAITVFFDI